jgi:hypothetical protein
MTAAPSAGPGVEAAVAAWASTGPSVPWRPTGAKTLKAFQGSSAVYRLGGVGPAGRDVIAKCTWRETVELERALYADVLPRLPVATVRCYGTVPHDDDTMAWLFLEDAGGAPYSPGRPEHRRLAARWLSSMHTSLTRRPDGCELPTRDTSYYRGLLERARRAIAAGLGNPAFTPEDLPGLRAALRRTELLLERWPDVEALCAGMPQTLVHADFVAKNVRVHKRAGTTTLRAFDWENAAWGLPAIDLRAIDLDEYARRIRGAWPSFGRSDMQTVARIGRIFWFTACIEWECWAFSTDCVGRLTNNLPVYERRLAAAMGELGWS